MSAQQLARRLFERRLFGKPLGVWLLWAVAVGVLAACPVIISDPGMWPYLFDPELLALVVVIGVQYTRIELGVLRLHARGWCAGRRDRRDGAKRLSGAQRGRRSGRNAAAG